MIIADKSASRFVYRRIRPKVLPYMTVPLRPSCHMYIDAAFLPPVLLSLNKNEVTSISNDAGTLKYSMLPL